MTYLIQYEGVLFSNDSPILQGFQLVQSLAPTNRLVLMTSSSRARVEHQLRTERLQDRIADIVDESAALPPIPLWRRQVEWVRSQFPVAYVVTAQPEIAEYAVEHGMVGLFFAHPGFSRPAQRPEQGNRSWEQLVAELQARWSGV